MDKQTKRRELIRFGLCCALITWGILCYAKLGEFMYNGTLFARVMDGRPYVSDFSNVYNAGVLAKRCLTTKEIDIYNIDIQNNSLRELIAPIAPEQPFYLQYPPYFFVLTLPLSFVSMNLAWLAWNAIGLVLCVLGIMRLAHSLGMKKKDTLLLIAFTLSSYPAWLSVELGQTSTYLLAAAVFMISFLKENRFYLAGLSSSILMIKLQYLPIFFFIGAYAGRLKFLSTWFVSMLVLLLLSSAILGWDNLLSYPQALIAGETGAAVSGVSSFMMQNLRGELVLLLKDNESLVKKIVLAAFGIGFCISAWLLHKVDLARTINSSRSNMSLGLSLMIALLASPHTHVQDYFLLAASAVLILPSLSDDMFAAKWIRSMFIYLAPLSWLFFYIQPLLLLVSIQALFLYVLLLSILVFLALKPQFRATPQGEPNPTVQ